jgi:hypothetical protein
MCSCSVCAPRLSKISRVFVVVERRQRQVHSMGFGSDVRPVATPTRTLNSTAVKPIPLYEVRDNAHCLDLPGMTAGTCRCMMTRSLPPLAKYNNTYSAVCTKVSLLFPDPPAQNAFFMLSTEETVQQILGYRCLSSIYPVA